VERTNIRIRRHEHTHTHTKKKGGEEDDGVRDMTAVLLNPIVQKMQFAK
jgi:hypothetical protein